MRCEKEKSFFWSQLFLFLFRSYFLFLEMATVNTVKRYLAMALFGDISRYNDLDIFCNNELMGRDYSMKFIEKTRCRNKPKDSPIKLLFRKHIDF